MKLALLFARAFFIFEHFTAVLVQSTKGIT